MEWRHQNFFFFCGDIEGAKCISAGAKSKNLPKMADFCHFFPNWGKWGRAEPPTGGANAPSCLSPLDHDAATEKM